MLEVLKADCAYLNQNMPSTVSPLLSLLLHHCRCICHSFTVAAPLPLLLHGRCFPAVASPLCDCRCLGCYCFTAAAAMLWLHFRCIFIALMFHCCCITAAAASWPLLPCCSFAAAAARLSLPWVLLHHCRCFTAAAPLLLLHCCRSNVAFYCCSFTAAVALVPLLYHVASPLLPSLFPQWAS